MIAEARPYTDDVVLRRLIERGYPAVVALRVACTPPILMTPEAPANDSRPGLDLFVGLGLQFGRVVAILGRHMLLPQQGGVS